MKSYKLYIFDADGTLRRCTVEGQPCPNRAGEWELIPGVKERLAKIDWSSTAFGVASNQGGIALGYANEAEVYEMLGDMVGQATGYWPPVNSIRICPHLSTAGCACRKPAPAMLQRLMEFWRVTPAETLFVGDQESDRFAARAATCDFVIASDFFI
jgi:D-glycero-D-manno-heptose 1,7-bisphosphate phosphatase